MSNVCVSQLMDKEVIGPNGLIFSIDENNINPGLFTGFFTAPQDGIYLFDYVHKEVIETMKAEQVKLIINCKSTVRIA